MIDKNPIKTDIRRKRRQERFGSLEPCCVLCGYGRDALETLTPVTVGWLKSHGIEMHHVVEKARDDNFIVPLCLNHHREVTEALARVGISRDTTSDKSEWVAQMLEGLASFLEYVIDALRRWAKILRNSVGEPAVDNA
jgi:hypothetical protein